MIAAFSLATLSIVPWPRSIQFGSQTFAVAHRVHVRARLLKPRDTSLGDEGYTLSIVRGGASIAANTPAGLFYAHQTLQQIEASAGTTMHAVAIRDWPQYRWRGMHLDVARHFFDVPTVERYIDLAAHYKLNVFHWHLTDDQAWRLPVAPYGLLTRGRAHYTAADIRKVIAFAQRRFVTVVPEIEMPAHADAAIAAYPQFGCSGDTFCQTPGTIGFLGTVLDAVSKLFPSLHVHIGGDEVPASYNQTHFLATIAGIVRSLGQRIVGWDEILNAQPPPGAIIEAWNDLSRAAAAAHRRYDTIVSGWPLYFDAAQGDPSQEPPATRHVSTLAQVYSWDVMPNGLSAAERAHVLGGEGAIWTERIPTPQHLFYMALPRELALSEILWTPRNAKSWNAFLRRLPDQFDWLASHGYNFRIPNVAIVLTGGRTIFTAIPGQLQAADAWTDASRLYLRLGVPLNGSVHYTLN
ncbi:MAG TPA: family 20 glycosylhydrolase, partial [Candidatus Rubrimentiphilum sp.]|nr:family 20 glycosylhydrolase [Candidatus Rubrimentiphilum sp.]